MKLYYAPGACSLAPHIALIEAGIGHTLARVDLARHVVEDGTDFHAIHPRGYVPLLVLEDGTRLSEAAVLLQYIADRRPDTLAPVPGTRERYKLMEWLNFIATELHKGFGPLWNPATPASVREAVQAQLARRFAVVEEQLGKHDYLAGDAFTVADAYLFTIAGWGRLLDVDLTGFPRLTAYLERVAARPAVQRALAREGLLKAAA